MRRTHIFIRPEVYFTVCVCLLLLPLKLIVSWLISVTVHEIFHYVAIKLSGGQVGHIQVGISGVKMQTVPMNHLQELFCAAAGPLGGSLLFILFLKKMPMLAVFGLLHSAFNLIPLYPLDGGRILYSLVGALFRKYDFDRIINIMDSTLSLVLFLGVLFTIFRFALGPLPLLLVLGIIFNNRKVKYS